MSLCQEGLDCVWGRRYENTIICSMPHCPMVRLRSGNVDKLRREFIAHAKQGPDIGEFDVDAMVSTTVGENDAGDGIV
ncbi:hypothetical protein [Alicyclobacillus sp. SO9]|uniref:hypothetical protein n=1 Tax=Alicyclobacillus sp. SO9 TaxID=2665646 RepID=UPI0018E8A03B|nr:hypothetical protein [Alicyclobacillus sp. SO9]QQE77488.1 hypothetical protein GI364_16270 [Alicyclobacillus sp. SO9]